MSAVATSGADAAETPVENGEEPQRPVDRGIALITGASRGIGRAIALSLSGQGYRIVAVGRHKEPLDELIATIAGRGRAVPFDVSLQDGGLLDRLPSQWRNIDVLVNNAGSDVGGQRPFHTGEMHNWQSTVETNFMGLMRVTREVLPGMVARGRGHVVNIGSSVVHRSYPGSAAYAASKSAVHGFSDCLRAEHVGSGIRVTEILPGAVRTDFDAMRKFGDSAAAKAFYDDFGIVLTPDDVARAVVFALNQPPGVVVAQMTLLPESDW